MLSKRNTVRHDVAYTYDDSDLKLEWFPLKIIFFRNSPDWELCSLGRVQRRPTLVSTPCIRVPKFSAGASRYSEAQQEQAEAKRRFA